MSIFSNCTARLSYWTTELLTYRMRVLNIMCPASTVVRTKRSQGVENLTARIPLGEANKISGHFKLYLWRRAGGAKPDHFRVGSRGTGVTR